MLHREVLILKAFKILSIWIFPILLRIIFIRIGRTARADNCGFAYTFFTPQNYKHSNELLRIILRIKCKISLQDCLKSLMSFVHFQEKEVEIFEHHPSKIFLGILMIQEFLRRILVALYILEICILFLLNLTSLIPLNLLSKSFHASTI